MTATARERRAFEMWVIGFVRTNGPAGAVARAVEMATIDPEPEWWNRAATYIRCAYRVEG